MTNNCADDPGWLLAFACYRFPDADSPQDRRMLRLAAVFEMRKIARRYERLMT